MGMYDTVKIECPNCKGELYKQSKSGDCMLKEYTIDKVPANIASSLISNPIICYYCNYEITIIADIPPPQFIKLKVS